MALQRVIGKVSDGACPLRLCVLVLLAFVLAGCSPLKPIYSTTGLVLTHYSVDHATPYTLASGDPYMACRMGTSLDPLLFSFHRVAATPNKTGSLMMLLAGFCAVNHAWDAELRYLRALRDNDLEAARDARTENERWLVVAAKRRLKTFERGMHAYVYTEEDEEFECPNFATDQDELTFALALLTGLQAVINDAGAGSVVGVPRNIPARAEVAAGCLDNEKWGGIPEAIQASVWLLLPDRAPEGAEDPWVLLERNARLGLAQGMRVPSALHAVMAQTMGNTAELAEAVKALAPGDGFTPHPDYQMVDAIARAEILAVSDRYWTRHHGERTPRLRLGYLGPPEPEDHSELDSLL